MPQHRAIATTLILAVSAGMSAGCGGDEDESPPPKDASQEGPSPEAILSEAITDMEQFIPEDLNRQMRSDGRDFRVRSIDCAPKQSTFTATCVTEGEEGRSYAVKVNVKRSDGSYTYNCPRCP